MHEKSLASDIQFLKGVGPKIAAKLEKLKIRTVYDLLTHFPRAYEDRTLFARIGSLNQMPEGDLVTISGIVVHIEEREIRPRNLYILSIWIRDDSGEMKLTWFNQRYLATKFHYNQRLIVSGKIKWTGYYADEITLSPIKGFDIVASETNIEEFLHIMPIYPSTSTITQTFFRNRIRDLFATLTSYQETSFVEDGRRYWHELVPQKIRERLDLNRHWGSIREVHFPRSFETLKKARRTLAFEELFLIQCGLLHMKQKIREEQKGISHRPNGKLIRQIFESLPFELTKDQRKSIDEIFRDMESDLPMRRLLQGDVGSGKTILAMLALAKTVESGFQGAMMMPTEILARQHLETFEKFLTPIGIRVGFLSGHLTKKRKEKIYEEISNHEVDIVIGTHALIQEGVRFAKLGLVITDEQHRFGVSQRARLEKLSSIDLIPDMLSMTATPIPRTLTLTVYGDLDVSSIHELPPGRVPIETKVVRDSGRRRMYQKIRGEILKGRQAYVVCPRIEAEDPFEEGMQPLDAAGNRIEQRKLPSVEEVYEELSNGIFSGINCALLHGKMKSRDKDQIMEEFRDGKISLLISTTVIEVGVDVPNATIMVIEHAEQFGLAQLHQLRGRVGRGTEKSICYLLSDSKSDVASDRLKTMEDSTDGFFLAETDLRLRGPGQFFTGMQHGLPDLKMANVIEDMDLLKAAHESAIETLDDEKSLQWIFKMLNLTYGIDFESVSDN
ncbi:MAG: ATP-dependent DNA helicase RecG [Selenomonadaceae bacterium]|nr:ATP-dependent DNA helicase RecG [Selenomonadaceae bacterium]